MTTIDFDDALSAVLRALVHEGAQARLIYAETKRGEATTQRQRQLQVHEERRLALEKARDILEAAQ
jgi:hypothetical protein